MHHYWHGTEFFSIPTLIEFGITMVISAVVWLARDPLMMFFMVSSGAISVRAHGRARGCPTTDADKRSERNGRDERASSPTTDASVKHRRERQQLAQAPTTSASANNLRERQLT
jgi:hypothetical protein